MKRIRVSIWFPLVGLLASFAGMSVLTYVEIATALEQNIVDRKTPDSLLLQKIFTSPVPADVDDEYVKKRIIQDAIAKTHRNTLVSVYRTLPDGQRQLIADNSADVRDRIPLAIEAQSLAMVKQWEADGQTYRLSEGQRFQSGGIDYHVIGQRFPLTRGEPMTAGAVVLTTNLDATIAKTRGIFIVAKTRTAVIVAAWSITAILINVVPIVRLTRYVQQGLPLTVWWWAPRQIADLAVQMDADRADERLARSQAQMAMQRLEELQKDWRHDLLSNIKGVYDMFELLDILGFKVETPEYKETYNMARKAAASCYNLVRETRHLNDAAKALKLEAVKVSDIFDELRVKYSQYNVIFMPPEVTDVVNIDRGEFVSRALANLVNNAIRYSNPPNEKVEVSYRQKGNTGNFFIKDNGIGISESGQARIMSGRGEAVRLNPEIEGSGLGLHSARRIVEMHNGKLKIKSKLGAGSIFIISLPLI